jgi:hypothetical protein
LDQGDGKLPNHKIGIISTGYVAPTALFDSSVDSTVCECDPRPYLKNRKDLKFLSKQDSLALIAASKAWESVENLESIDPDRVGIYLGVGILPFEDTPLDTLAQKSTVDGAFDIAAFSTTSIKSMSPLLTFKCLPNMPLFHISYNLGITGRYYMTYPGLLEWFSALERAISDLEHGLVDYAMVGAIADQRNFLVQKHLQRVIGDRAESAVDSAAVFVLKRVEDGSVDGVHGIISSINSTYVPYNPLKQKEHLFPTMDQLSCFTGIVEPALFLINYLTAGNQDLVCYKTKLGEIELQLEVELL